MTLEDKDKVVPPADNSSANGKEGQPSEDVDFDKELKNLESTHENSKPVRTELEKATFTAKSTLKRIKELGGNPTQLLQDGTIVSPEKTEVDTTQFVTKADLAYADASKLAKSPNELNVIMWWVKNKGMSVEDAHFMANKGRIMKTVGEITRGNAAIPANGGGGAGQRVADKTEVPDLSIEDKRRVTASGMIFDPTKKAYVGKKVQLRYDESSKGWMTERI